MDAEPEEASRPSPAESPPTLPAASASAQRLSSRDSVPPAMTGSVLSLREMRFEMQRPLLDDIGRFLAVHGLDVMPYTLTIAYDCVSGFNPRLSLQIQERTDRGEPITLSWLEDVARESGRSREESMISRLMGKLEESLEYFGQTQVEQHIR